VPTLQAALAPLRVEEIEAMQTGCKPRAVTMDGPSDEELVARFKATLDAPALELLVWRYLDTITLLITVRARQRRLGPHDAEDACQTMFAVLRRAAQDYDPARDSNFRTFLLRWRLPDRLSKVIRSQWRLRRRYSDRVPIEEVVEQGEGRAVGRRHRGRTYDADEPPLLVHRQEGYERLGRALARLTPREQWLVAAWTEHVSQQAMAERLRVSERTVQRDLARTFARLRTGMGGWEP
jgi:RNA polymerase sigma factor (sigma-70 family)